MSYTKPMILVNDDLAEGVYAASGASQVTVTPLGNNDNPYWKTTSFHVCLSGDYGVVIVLTFDFNRSDVNINGGSGNTLTINNPSSEFDIEVVGDWDIVCNGATLETTKQSW